MDNEQLRRWLQTINQKSEGWEKASEQFSSWFIDQHAFFRIADDILKNESDAKDVIQEVVIKLGVIGVAPPTGDVFNWCCKSIANKSIDFLRTRQRQPQELDSDVVLEGKLSPDSSQASHKVEQEELLRVYGEAKENALTPLQKKIVLLVEEGYKNTEIADELNITTRTVEREKYRVIQRIRDYVSRHYAEYSF